MADIFVSYAREDIERAARIGEFLAARGFSVWWDRELTAGDRFAMVVQDALVQAKAVVVLWSKNSVDSHWVHAEASEALERNILIPVIFDGATPPLEFRKIHSLSFDGWMPDIADPAGEELIRALSRRVGASGPVGLTDLSETIVSRLGSRLLSAKTSFELQEGLYELERFLASNPFHTQARMLQERFKVALASELTAHQARQVGVDATLRRAPERSGSIFRRYATAATVVLTITISSFIGLTVLKEKDRSQSIGVSPPGPFPEQGADPLTRERAEQQRRAQEREPNFTTEPEPRVSEGVRSIIKIAAAHRERGDYSAALAALEKAREIDPSDPAILKETERTKTACNAEKQLGRSELVCEAVLPKEPLK